MGAPTNAANVKKALANPEPSTHGGRPEVVSGGANRREMTHHGHGTI